LTFADQVVVMTRGKAVQVGPADALFERPQHTFVGHFIGSPGMNFVAAEVRGTELLLAGQTLPLPPGRALPVGPVKVGIRPEYLTVAAPGAAGAVPAQLRQVQDVGTHLMLTAELSGGQVLKVRLSIEAPPPPPQGGTLWLQLLGEHTCFYVREELVP
jgi:glycerol transport system ATP-binding protein